MLFKATITSFTIRHLQKPFAIGAKLINTDYINDMVLSGSDDSLIAYQLRSRFDRDTKFEFIVSDTLAEVVAGAAVAANADVLALPIFVGDDTTNTAVTHYYVLNNIAWCENATSTTAYMYVQEGTDLKRFLVDYNVDQIMDIANAGATTTTTTTTTSTTTSA